MQSSIAETKTDTPVHGEHFSSPPNSRDRSQRSRLLLSIFGALLIGLGAGLSASGLLADDPATAELTAPPQLPVVESIIDRPLSDASTVADVVIPSVVTVQVSGAGGAGSGSGVVYDDAGRILTNHHVVDVGTEFAVVLADGRTYEATLLGSDRSTDLAVLQIEAEGIPAIALGSSEQLSVGVPAIAVGSPLGLDGGPSLSVGVISSLQRIVRTAPDVTLYGMLQTDAPITQGSSGGALVDAKGRLIGITTAVGVSSVGVEGIGFATPVEIVTRVADEIIATGEASNPILGITGNTAYGPTDDGGRQPIGVTVLTVTAESPAESAGLEVGDTVTSVAGVPVHTMEGLIAQLRRFGAGDTIGLGIDGGPTGALSVTLANR